MRLIGCDLHASQQSIALLDRDTGVVVEKKLTHEAGAVREFYASIPPPVVVGIEATGSMGWFLRLMEELAMAEERFVDAEVVGYAIVKLTVTVRIASKPIGAYFHCLTASIADRANASFVDRRTVMSPIVPSA